MTTLNEVRAGFAGLDADPAAIEAALASLERWLTDPELASYTPYIEHLAARGDHAALLDSFWRVMPFGTGGRRGPVGVGPNRINPYTITLSVQGHCDYLRAAAGGDDEIAVVLAWDVREFFDLRGNYRGVDGPLGGLTSRELARQSASVYAANGIATHLVGREQGFLSTPELSFLIRELGAAGGLNISASHNHPDDNGGKFYNAQGGQQVPPYDQELLEVVERVTRVDSLPFDEAVAAGLVREIPAALHVAYLELNERLCPTESRSAPIAFSPLCGTGKATAGEALDRLGFDIYRVPEQNVYDGSFAPVRMRIANPELPESLDRLEEIAEEHGCDVGFATDPDADRLGMIVRDREGRFVPLTGNEIGAVLIETILSSRRRRGLLPDRPLFINTVVTSSLQRAIARRHGCQVVGDLMVGFKYHADVLGALERSGRYPEAGADTGGHRAEGTVDDFVFGCEEAHGYLLSPRVRDKDACGPAVHLAGIACALRDKGRTLHGLLRDIYRVYGYHANVQRSLTMEGIAGLERMQRIQRRLRENPPEEVAGLPVRRFVDHQKVGGPLRSDTDAASRNVLRFELDDGERSIRLIVRPSGTEPKTKIYVEVPSRSTIATTLEDTPAEQLAAIEERDLDRQIAEAVARAREVGDAFIMHCLGPAVLGNAYPELPPELLLVSDLVPVDQKVRFCVELLPALLARLTGGEESASWLERELDGIGAEARAKVSPAAVAWLDRASREGAAAAAVEGARALFSSKTIDDA